MEQNIKYIRHKKTNLAEGLNLTGSKPAAMLFNGKEFCYMRREGWKGLYTDLAMELYKIAPKVMKEMAAMQQEFFISDEPVLWSVGNRKPAENYADRWWVEVGPNVFIYTKNNTLAKIQRMRGLLDACGIAPAEVVVILF